MTDEQRKQAAMPQTARSALEELAELRYEDSYAEGCYMAGAQAAFEMREAEVAELKERLAFSGAGECGLEGWECKKARMEAVREAVEKERKRCYRIIADTFAGDERTPCAWDKILNPARGSEGKDD